MNYDYDVDLHGTWSRDETQGQEADWFIRRFKEPEDGQRSYGRLPDRDGKQIKRPFTTVSMSIRAVPNISTWRPVKRSGRFHVKVPVKAPTPTKALELAEKKVRDYIIKVTCNPPTLTFL